MAFLHREITEVAESEQVKFLESQKGKVRQSKPDQFHIWGFFFHVFIIFDNVYF